MVKKKTKILTGIVFYGCIALGVASIFYWWTGIILILIAASYFIWASSEIGRKVIDKLPVTDDVDGNQNINRKPWDLL